MSKKSKTTYENYPDTPEKMKKLWKRFFIAWAIVAGVAIVGEIVFDSILASIYDPNGAGDSFPQWTDALATGVILFVIAGFPLLYSAWLGGRAIHRWGPLGTVPVIVGMFVVVGGGEYSPVFGFIGVALMAIGVIVCFYLGNLSNVPMWLQLPIFKSPRLYINNPKNKKPRKR